MTGNKFLLLLSALISTMFIPYANAESGRVMIGVSCRVIRTGDIKFCPIVYSEKMPLDLKNALENIDIKCPEGSTLSLSYHIEKISSYQNQPFCALNEKKVNESIIKFYKNADCIKELHAGEKLKIDFRKKDEKGTQPIYCKFDPEKADKHDKSSVDENENVILIIELNY